MMFLDNIHRHLESFTLWFCLLHWITQQTTWLTMAKLLVHCISGMFVEKLFPYTKLSDLLHTHNWKDNILW